VKAEFVAFVGDRETCRIRLELVRRACPSQRTGTPETILQVCLFFLPRAGLIDRLGDRFSEPLNRGGREPPAARSWLNCSD